MTDTNFHIHQLVQSTAQQLSKKYHNEELCRQYAWWVLEAITQQKKTNLIAQSQIQLTTEQYATLTYWIEKQVKDNIPLQYLIGSVPFASCDILVEPPILIPRPETEEWCIDLIEQLKKASDTPLRILDLCTGSGCIALALAKGLPHARIYASDISDTALALAQKNAEHNNIHSITFLSSDLLQDIPPSLQFDLIVANPPYISQQEWKYIDASVKEWEDPLALLAPDEGLGIVKQIITEAKNFLQPHTKRPQQVIPSLIIEIGYKQGPQVKQLFEQEYFNQVTIHKDVQNKDRTVVGYLTHEGSAE